ncbi:hypothetical protein, partial [Pseudomonas lundensis]|uniref:hypothetical protein n=1 Tax=Pseudomonas lundensis TaxID=86185 RepID=UPI001EEE78E1
SLRVCLRLPAYSASAKVICFIEKLGDWCPEILPNQEVFFRISLAEWEIGHRASCSQLLPNVPLVHSTLSAVSHGEQVFIAVLGDSIMETVCSRSIASPMK